MAQNPPPLNQNPQSTIADHWKAFEIHKSSMAAVGKSQARFVSGLLGFLAILWGWHFMRPEGMALQFLGVSINPSGLWTIAPAVLTIVSLALIGSMNVMGTVWRRLDMAASKLGQPFFWGDLDTNKNILDYLTYLKIWPEGPVEATSPPVDITRKWSLYVFSYPLALALATVTTFMADHPGARYQFKAYVYTCGFLQILFSSRIWYRALCRFLGVRREQTEV